MARESDRTTPIYLAIGLDSVLETIEFPAGIAHLDSGLADMDRNDLSHDE